MYPNKKMYPQERGHYVASITKIEYTCSLGVMTDAPPATVSIPDRRSISGEELIAPLQVRGGYRRMLCVDMPAADRALRRQPDFGDAGEDDWFPVGKLRDKGEIAAHRLDRFPQCG